MPRGRKSKASTGSPASQAQATLSFNSKSARVTKPTTRQDEGKKKTPTKSLSEPAQAQIEEEVTAIQPPEPEEEVQSVDVDVTPEAESSLINVTNSVTPAEVQTQSPRPKTRRAQGQADKDVRELAAEKVTDAQIKRYWRAEEDSRLAPRGTSTCFFAHRPSKVTVVVAFRPFRPSTSCSNILHPPNRFVEFES